MEITHQNVVVLMMENRSFDHMLGWLKKTNPSINGVTGKECNPVSTKDPKSKPPMCFTDGAQYVDPDPGHSFQAVEHQVFGSDLTPMMNGFVEQAMSMGQNMSSHIMKGFKPDAVPVYTSLVENFAVVDRWFSSIPGPTQPNRLFVYSATSHGAISHIKKDLILGYPQKTLFDCLHENGIDFGIYHEMAPATLFYRNLRKLKYVSKFHPYGLDFKKHAKNGKLPSFTVIEPRYFDIKILPTNDDHPSHDVSNEQKLVKEVYETLRGSPQWKQTLLIVTYDEHGGFYDHVPTLYVNIPNPDGNIGPDPFFFKFDRLGVRVPTLMISPWIKKGTIVGGAKGPTANSEYEHSSIRATIKKLFNLTSDFLTKRDAWAGTFEHVLESLTSPRTDCPDKLPETKPMRNTEPDENRGLSEFQTEIVQLAQVLNGDRRLSNVQDEMGTRMSVKEGYEHTKRAVSRFFRAGKSALKMGVDKDAVVDMTSFCDRV